MSKTDGHISCYECGTESFYEGAADITEVEEQTGFWRDPDTNAWYCPDHTPEEINEN